MANLAVKVADLEAASQVDMTARLLDEAPHQARVTVESIQEVLDMIAGAIPREIAADYLRTVRIQTATFGLHAARLDIREHARVHRRSIAEIYRVLGICDDYESLSEEERIKLVCGHIADRRPLIPAPRLPSPHRPARDGRAIGVLGRDG